MTDTERLCRTWKAHTGCRLWQKARAQIPAWLEKLPFEEVEEAIVIAAGRDSPPIDCWRYFIGVCKRKVAGDDSMMVPRWLKEGAQ